MRSSLLLSTVLILLVPIIARALPGNIPEDVPLQRLIQNLEETIKVQPDQAHVVGQLARLHLFAFARGLEDSDKVNPLLFSWGGLRPGVLREQPGDVVQKHWEHLLASIDLYHQGIRLNPNYAPLFLGLGCSYEIGSIHVAKVALPPVHQGADEVAARQLKRIWEDKALDAYRQVLPLLPAPTPEGYSGDPNFREEAVSGIIHILSQRKKLSRAEKKELKQAKQELEDWAKTVRVVTPIVFSLQEGRSLDKLIDQDVTVKFDLEGLGRQINWPWVRPDTWLMVWDPDGKGEITSGRQLFGSITWWMFWKNGYEAMAALDDNKDGRLRGSELACLAAWQDRNSNGRSEAGEVVSLSALGIVQLDTAFISQQDGTPWQPQGLQLQTGQRLPTYDWMVKPRPADE